jgi:hypothetical protein
MRGGYPPNYEKDADLRADSPLLMTSDPAGAPDAAGADDRVSRAPLAQWSPRFTRTSLRPVVRPSAGWLAMLEQLGLLKPLPLPASRLWRRHETLPDDDEPPESCTEMARRLGISRQLAHYRLRRMRRPQRNDK